MKWVQLCDNLCILWHCLSLGLEWKLTFSSPVATAKFSKSSKFQSVIKGIKEKLGVGGWNCSTVCSGGFLRVLAQAAITEYHRLGSLDDRDLFSHSFGGWNSRSGHHYGPVVVCALFLACRQSPSHSVCTCQRGEKQRERDTETDRQIDTEKERHREIERVLCCLFFFFEGKYSYYFI